MSLGALKAHPLRYVNMDRNAKEEVAHAHISFNHGVGVADLHRREPSSLIASF